MHAVDADDAVDAGRSDRSKARGALQIHKFGFVLIGFRLDLAWLCLDLVSFH